VLVAGGVGWLVGVCVYDKNKIFLRLMALWLFLFFSFCRRRYLSFLPCVCVSLFVFSQERAGLTRICSINGWDDKKRKKKESSFYFHENKTARGHRHPEAL
jgi:hypothetical protein